MNYLEGALSAPPRNYLFAEPFTRVSLDSPVLISDFGLQGPPW